MRTLYLFRLSFRRLYSSLGLTLLSLLGVVLSVGMVTCIPIFSHAVSFLVLREELSKLSTEAQRPPFALRFFYVSSKDRPLDYAAAQGMQNVVKDIVSERLQLPITHLITEVNSPRMVVRPAAGDLRFGGREDVNLRQINFAVLPELNEHITIIDGVYLGEAASNERLPVWVNESLSDEMGMYAGEKFDLLHPGSGEVVPVYVAGVWKPRGRQDPYWFYEPTSTYRNMFVVTAEAYQDTLEPLFQEKTGFVSWYVVVDESAMALDKADAYYNGLQQIGNVVAVRLPGTYMDYSPEAPLDRYIKRKTTLSVILVGFSLPAMGLLFYFLSLISTVTVLFQRQESAILSSRGSGRGIIVMLSLFEAILLIGLGTPLGLLAGYGLARLMGNSLSFLTFVQRPPLPASPWAFDWRLLGAALLILLITRLIPAFRASRESIVTHGQKRARPPVFDALRKIAIDVPLIITSAYAYRQLNLRGTLGVIGWEPSGDPFRDPLILLAPSLFIFTAALVASHLFPLLIRPSDLLGSWIRSFSSSMGLRQLVRQSGYYTSNLFLVIVCLSLGAFYSSMAQSLDQWLGDRVYYRVGADFAFQQGSTSQEGIASGEGSWLLPVEDYKQISGVERAIRVGDYAATPRNIKAERKGRFLGVDRLDFPQVAFFREDFSDAPLGELMNRLGMYQNGVLVSEQFLKDNMLLEGQTLSLEIQVSGGSERVEFLIVGTFEYFPTLYPKQGEVFVGNLDYLFDQVGGASPHQIWLNLSPDADVELLLKQIDQMGIVATHTGDARLLVMEDEDRVERVGLFGVLSIGFLAGSILSALGLLVYTYASLQGRLHQFSILRAMGAKISEVLRIVSIEYAGVIAYGVLVGAAVGIVGSRLFVPFFQYTSDASLAVPPFAPQIAWAKIVWIAVAFAGALVLSQIVILYGVTKRDVFQMLRMGQRE
jgi:putative ABC transport system permease protein